MATIRKREGKNGVSYLIRVSAGYDAQGKQIVHSMTWRPEPGMKKKAIEKELQRQAVLFEECCAGLSSMGGSQKFEMFARSWFENYAEKKLRPRTIEFRHQMEERTYTAIGHIRLDKLNARHVQAFINNLQEPGIVPAKIMARDAGSLSKTIKGAGYTRMAFSEKSGVGTTTLTSVCTGKSIRLETAEKIAQSLGKKVSELFTVETTEETVLSAKTIRNYYAFVSAVLDYAVKMGIIKENPAKNVALPSYERKEKEVYSLEEAQRFLDCLETAPLKYQAFFTLAMFGGFRRSELLGLEWDDIDFEHRTVTVRRTSHYTKAEGVHTDTTKTQNSQRTLKLPESVFAVLRQHKTEQTEMRLACGSAWHDTNRLFTSRLGGYMFPGVPFHWLKKFCEKNGLRCLGIHQFRHLNATLLITSGVDARTVSYALGHAMVSTTLNIYAHTFAETQAQAGEAIADVLRGKIKTS